MSYFKCLSFILMGLLTCSTVKADRFIDALVPAYANPCCDGGPNMWNSLIASAADVNRNYQLHAIFNPASGPGTARDGNYLDGSGQGPLNDFINAGGISHGYVATGFGTRNIADVKADVDAYLSGHYQGFVSGIFFDEMSNDLADVGYYQELNAYVQSISAGARTFGNPGTTFVNNPSGQSVFDADDFVNSLGTIMSFENTRDEYTNNYTSFSHLEGLDRQKIAHVIHTQSTWDASLLDVASARGAGFLYVTDDVLPPDNNPYDTLASYWGQFTADLSAHNASVPEPATPVVIGMVAVVSLLRRTSRSSRN